MIGAILAAALVVVAAMVIGQAILAISGRREWSWLAPGVGLAALLIIGAATVRLPGRSTTAAIVIALVSLAAAVYLYQRVEGTRELLRAGLPPALIAGALISLPFLITGRVDVLGVGLINDDMASHLLIADFLRNPSGVETPVFVQGGYPFGPHAIVAGLTDGTSATLVESFAGLTLALAALTALTALAFLGHLPPVRRTIAAVLAAIAYLGASYLVSGAFKEPLQALILIAFALTLADLVGMRSFDAVKAAVGRGGPKGTATGASPTDSAGPELPARAADAGVAGRDASAGTRGADSAGPLSTGAILVRALPLGVLAAGSIFNYSLAGLLWIGAVGVLVIGARFFLGPPVEITPELRRTALRLGFIVVAVVALSTVQEWGRIADFTRLESLNPDRFESDLGNLRGAISPLEALGVWPSGEYRISASNAGVPAPLFYLGGLLAAVGLGIGLLWAWREKRLALPLALVATLAIWGLASVASTPYIAAKALAIGAPIAMIVALAGVLVPGSRLRFAVAVLLVPAALLSSFLAIRQAPVAPAAHRSELADIRRPVRNDKLLFLGRDDFIAHEMRRARIFAPIINHYNVDEVAKLQPFQKGREKFDFDAVSARVLDRVTFALTTNGGPVSQPPEEFEAVAMTPSYTLWKRQAPVQPRETLDEGVAPGAVLDCSTPEGRSLSRESGVAAVWPAEPIEGAVDAWAPKAEATHERAATQTLDLPPGDWEISLQYDSRRPITVSAPGLEERLPANLDFRGPSPYFPVGTVSVGERTELPVSISVDRPNSIARLLGAPNDAHLRGLAATPVGPIEQVALREACDRYVDWYRVG